MVETLSVIMQVTSFRLFHRRVFRMAPIHHHFELVGWPETTVIVRFWILAGLCVALALGFFYADFIHIGVATDRARSCTGWGSPARPSRPRWRARRHRGRRAPTTNGVPTAVHLRPRDGELSTLLESVDMLVPSPGVPEHHPASSRRPVADVRS